MSILSEALRKKITWPQAASAALAWTQKLVAHDETLVTAASEAQTIVKQGFSDAISLADTALSGHAADLADAVEAALEAALAAATGGKSVALNPLIDTGVDQLVNVVVAAAHAKAMEFKASLAVVAPPVVKAS